MISTDDVNKKDVKIPSVLNVESAIADNTVITIKIEAKFHFVFLDHDRRHSTNNSGPGVKQEGIILIYSSQYFDIFYSRDDCY